MPSLEIPQHSFSLAADHRGGAGETARNFNRAAVGVIAHDFNNLLMTILGNLSLALFNPRLDLRTQEQLVTAKRAGLRAQELAQQLLTLAKQPVLEPAQPRGPGCVGGESADAAPGVIADHFNDLLMTILGDLSLAICNPRLDDATQERLATAKKAGLRAQELSQDLRKLDAGSTELPDKCQPHQAECSPGEAATRARRVLVLDDEEAICALITCALEPLGYEVVETHDALAAIACYTEALKTGRRFDIVISDLTIPGGMGGEEAVRILRKVDPSLQAVVSSGYSSDPILSDFREHGFCAAIQKPYEIGALSRTLEEILAAAAVSGSKVVEHDFTARATA